MLVLDLSEYKVVTKKSVKKLTCRRERDSKPVDIYRDSITTLICTYGGGGDSGHARLSVARAD